MNTAEDTHKYEATTNACKLCTPLGASLVFKGVRGAISLMHGSQGCSTYIRRYLISHFKEPIDIASSNFSEDTAIFGGGANLKTSIANVIRQYQPELVGISTTCLSETIGDDVPMILSGFRNETLGSDTPPIVHVSTPSYTGTHADGFTGALKSLVESLAPPEGEASPDRTGPHVNLLPGMVSPADMRYLKEIVDSFGLGCTMLPDYSETLDGGPWTEYHKIPEGGTPVNEITAMVHSDATIEFSMINRDSNDTAAGFLKEKHEVPDFRMGIPIGVRETDRFFGILESISKTATPERFRRERERLLDSFIDGHKYVFGAKAVVYGEEDFVASMVSFLTEIGITPSLCASGGTSRRLKGIIESIIPDDLKDEVAVLQASDFSNIEDAVQTMSPDIFIGNSKGYSISRKLDVPLVRVGFPVHDRIGGPRILHTGYRGAQELFDRITNALLERKQLSNDIGYSYL